MHETLNNDSVIGPSGFSSEYGVINRLPISIYDIALGGPSEPLKDVFGPLRGKVTLVFNVAAGCGNIPQHAVIEELNTRYQDNPDFSILAVVVDDFWCHGHPEFQDGLQGYIDSNQLDITPGQLSCDYAQRTFGTTYAFTSLTNGRYDKHSYDVNWVPGKNPVQRMHPFWYFLTGAYLADHDDRGIPFQNEVVGWTNIKSVSAPTNQIGYMPLTGNFEKFLIGRDGTRFIRYSNGFLLGKRDRCNNVFPWIQAPTDKDGIDDYRGNAVQITSPTVSLKSELFSTPHYAFAEFEQFGITHSLDLISEDIDLLLAMR